ncbi:hypothetical protein Adt_34562 [Abeliophyllum distichum]|uniref:Protein MIZU-KUSSEI 1-like n=1 Tax=Abeliophyllum distichum TaxID=126358 RepID=A0ABD1QZH1_9LAMI
MTKIDALRRFLLTCLHPTPNPSSPIITTTKKRLSTSLRDDLDDKNPSTNQEKTHKEDHHQDSSSSDPTSPAASLTAPSRPSRTMVIGTIFGHRRGGHVWFCVQHDRLNTRPSLLLELSIPTTSLVHEMQCGLVRIALEFNASDSPESELSCCPLHSVPLWSLFCNGRKLGFAVRRKATQQNRLMLKTMQNITVGAGVIPPGSGSEEIMYMRANYECVIGNAGLRIFPFNQPGSGPGSRTQHFPAEIKVIVTSFKSVNFGFKIKDADYLILPDPKLFMLFEEKKKKKKEEKQNIHSFMQI